MPWTSSFHQRPNSHAFPWFPGRQAYRSSSIHGKSVKWIQHTSPDTDNNRLYIQSTSITKSTPQVLEQYSTLINKSSRCTKMQNSFSVISMCYWLFLKLPCTYQTVLLKTRNRTSLKNTGVVWHLKQSVRRTARRNIRASFEFISVREITFRYQTC